MKPIEDFISKLDTSERLDETLIVEKQGRFFLINERLRRYIKFDFFYAGAYLGKVKRGVFFPSFILLAMISERQSNKVVVDDKTAWLFVCGRDIFKRGILSVSGSKSRGRYTLVLNRYHECLGFGRMIHDIDEVKDRGKVVVKNISDIGDFLRRER